MNEVDLQTVLWDRRLVLEILDQIGVPTPFRLTMDRDGGPGLDARVHQKLNLRGVAVSENRKVPEFKVIDQDTIQIGDRTITKPFVEKPVSGEDHNIHFYYHSSAGGGARRLFRKVYSYAIIIFISPDMTFKKRKQDRMTTDYLFIYFFFISDQIASSIWICLE